MDGEPTRILLVDDDPANAAALRTALAERAGSQFQILHVRQLAHALKFLAEEPFDVALLELNLPDSRGLNTLQRIRRQAPQVTTIVWSRQDDEAGSIRAIQAGADDVLVKGQSDGVTLARSIRHAIERHGIVETLQAFDRQKSDFIATASHEMRTPLAIIREFVTLVLDGLAGPVTQDQTECLTSAQRNCDRLAQLLNDLLDMTRLGRQEAELHRRRISMAALLRQCANDFRPMCDGKGQSLTLELPDGLPDAVCDAAKIEQVMVNLLGNATKFTPEGGSITIRPGFDQHLLWVEVEDTGRGIAEHDQERVFEAFVQVDREAGPGIRGTGLGLAITRRLVELHGGSVWVSSAPGKGSRFGYSLPAYHEGAELQAVVTDTWRTVRAGAAPLVLAVVYAEGLSSAAPEHRESRLAGIHDAMRAVLDSLGDGFISTCECFVAFAMPMGRARAMSALRSLGHALPPLDPQDGGLEYAVAELSRNASADEGLTRVCERFSIPA
jgi:signal transduction histidine kinase